MLEMVQSDDEEGKQYDDRAAKREKPIRDKSLETSDGRRETRDERLKIDRRGGKVEREQACETRGRTGYKKRIEARVEEIGRTG